MVHLDALCYAVPSFRSEVLPRNNINAQSCHSDSLVTIKLVWDPTDAVLCYCEGDGTGEGGGRITIGTLPMTRAAAVC